MIRRVPCVRAKGQLAGNTQRTARHRDIHMDMDMDMDMDMGANVPCWRAAIIQRESSTAPRSKLPITSSRAGCAGCYQRLSSAPIDIAAISTLVPQSSFKAALAQRDDSANVQISGMALTSRVPVPHSERQLAHERRLTCASCAVSPGNTNDAAC